MREWSVLLLVALAAAGCGTLSGTRQYQSIDSNPRGLVVTDVDENEVLGTTPLFAYRPRVPVQRLRLRGVGGVQEREERFSCDYRWGGSLLGNTAWITFASGSAGLAVGAFAAANAVDLLTGTAWHCPDRIVFEAPELAGQGVAERCPKYAVAPPIDGDERISLLLAMRWAERAVLRPCVSVVDPLRTYGVFARYNVTHEASFEPAHERRERLNALGFATGASHVAVLRAQEVGTRILVRPELYDLHSLAVVADAPFVIDLDAENGFDRDGALPRLRRYVSLLPNSIGFAAARRDLEYQPVGDVTSVAVTSPRASLPSLVGNLTLLWLRPPEEFDMWGLALRLTPTGVLSWNTRNLELRRPSGVEQVEVSAVFLVAALNGTMFWRTPIGIFSFSVGAGPGLTLSGEDGPFEHSSLDVWSIAEVAWTLFLTETVFVRAALGVSGATGDVVSTSTYRLDGSRAASISVGYYLPEFRAWIGNLL